MKKHFTKEAQIEIVEITDLPLFSEDIREIPEGVQKIAEAIGEADGLIFSTPEYDHAITAALKSLIEWLSWMKPQPLNGLPVMIVGVSLGNMGTRKPSTNFEFTGSGCFCFTFQSISFRTSS